MTKAKTPPPKESPEILLVSLLEAEERRLVAENERTSIADQLDEIVPISNATHNIRSSWDETIDRVATPTQRDRWLKSANKLVTAARNGTDPGTVKLSRIDHRLAKPTDNWP